ncbi:MAG: response regulator [Pleurocapsa sp. CRU_1_2]|nr:response regulator [Pleurocapsa sp. CRU_1_2]
MSAKKYNSNQLISILDSLFKKNSSGILSLTTQVDSWQQQRSCILILRNGALIYGGTKVSNAEELCFKIGEALKPNLIKAALSVAVERAKEPNSAVELLEMLIRMRAFTWQEVEALMNTKVLLIIEKFVPYSGEAQWSGNLDLDLSYGADRHGLNWSDIQQELKHRQQIWQNYAPQIPSMDAIPVVTPQQLRVIDNPQVADHFIKSVNGRASLVNIAEKMGKDPLKVATNYFNWANNGWVSFVESPLEAQRVISASIANEHGGEISVNSPEAIAKLGQDLPIVLSVDDSAIIQTSIKRALQADYNVLLASKATEALEILQEVKVELMLLDLTMPDIDGLEFCKTVRAFPQFRDLPIVMVTARDGLVNKMKGHIAGTSKYLTKPFKPEELREVVRQYIK